MSLYPSTQTYLVAQTLGATISFPGFAKENYLYVYIQGVVTSASSLNVSIKVQASADNTNWIDLSSPAAQTITTDGTYGWIVPAGAYKYLRLVSTRTGGSGTINAIYNMQ